MSSPYTREFYAGIGVVSRRSARQVLPLVADLVRPTSIVDVGCGSGEWLSVAMDLGITDVLGVDGDYASEILSIPNDRFVVADLNHSLVLERNFDLAMSVEVAEHLPPDRAQRFVEDLTRLAPVVLFGAAIPGQGGVGHVNEQWLDYWREQFSHAGFVMVDCIRRRVWDDPEIVYHSAQNLVLFVSAARWRDDEGLRSAHDPMPLRVVHPDLFELARPKPPSIGLLARQLPEATRRTVRAKRRQIKRLLLRR